MTILSSFTKKIQIISFIILAAFSCLKAQGDHTPNTQEIPRVFVLGQYQDSYENLANQFKTSLLEVSNQDINQAYKKWIHTLSEMEAYSKKINYDIRGAKLWLQIYWKADGTIAHIAYHLKPNSRNIPNAELNAFFKSFAKNYKMPVETIMDFSHYGTASFPLYIRQ